MAQVLKAKYFLESDYLNAMIKSEASFIAKSIFESRSIVRLCTCRQIGDGQDTMIYGDPLLPCAINPYYGIDHVI